jgi:hypothetical protein
MKSYLTYILILTTQILFGQQLTPVQFSFESGFYETAISLQLSHPTQGVQIYYTTNGSEPTQNSTLYSSPITLLDLNNQANKYSNIPTNPGLNFPIGDYTETRANTRGWAEPFNSVEKGHIIKAKAFKTGQTTSQTVTKSFFIDPLGINRYSFPVVSVVVDSLDMFSNESGIYVYGDNLEGNYTQKDEAWEKIFHFDYIENGTSVYNQDTRTRIHGGGSRHSVKKNLRMYGETGEVSNFTHPFFDDIELDKFKRILLRSGGHRPDCFPRDDLSQYLTDGINIDKQHYKHVIDFVNGEYWGIHTIKERIDNYFIQNLYGIDDDLITILDQEYDVQGHGHAEDSLELANIQSYIISEDMTLIENYEYVEDRIDVDNYIDYMCSEIYLSNVDWVFSNVVIWRKTGAYNPGAGPGHDGRFRWLMYDLDGGFGGDCSNAYYTVNTLSATTVSSGLYSSYTRFFRGMLESPIFRDKFINRMCDLLNTWFKPSVVRQKMDAFYTSLTPEMQENVERWRYPSLADNLADRMIETPTLTQWDTTFYYLRRFARRRDRKTRDHMQLEWTLPDSNYITVDVNDQNMGYVKVNSILINDKLPGVESSVYPWTGIYMQSISVPLKAIPKPGYRFVEWLGTTETDSDINWSTAGDSTFTAVFEIDPDYKPILINELMTRNTNYYADNFDEYDDWTELFNPNSKSIDLSNCKISKGADEWTIPNGTAIEPNGYLIFWHDKQTYQGNNHANYKLQNVADVLQLTTDSGELLDEISFPEMPKNHSYGRFPNGSQTTTIFEFGTPNMNNDFAGTETLPILNPLVAYPNPVSEVVYFNKKITGQIFNILGQPIAQINNDYKLDVNQIKAGVYFVKTTEKEVIKIIIN